MPLAGVGDSELGEAESPVRDEGAAESASAAARRAPMTASARAAGPVTPAAPGDGTSRLATAQAELRALMRQGRRACDAWPRRPRRAARIRPRWIC